MPNKNAVPREVNSHIDKASSFLRACQGLEVDRIPIWFPTRARSHLPFSNPTLDDIEIRELLSDPALIRAATLDPLSSAAPDGLMLFSDGHLPLGGMGIQLSEGHPKGLSPSSLIQSTVEIDRLGTPPAEEHMGAVLEAVKLTSESLQELSKSLIGWSESPFTLAAATLGGQTSGHFQRLKSFLYHEPAAWKRLMDKLVTVTGDFLLKQAQAGTDALIVFDPYSGLILSDHDLHRHVFPYHAKLFHMLERVDIPVLHHTSLTFPALKKAIEWGDVISLDYRIPLKSLQDTIGLSSPVQINLDPIALLAPWHELTAQVDHLLRDLKRDAGILVGVGGSLPQGSFERNLTRLVDYVHSAPEIQSDRLSKGKGNE